MKLFIVSDSMTGYNYIVKADDPAEAESKLRMSIVEQDKIDSYLHYVGAVKSINENIKKDNEWWASRTYTGECDEKFNRKQTELCEIPTYEEWIEDYEVKTKGEFVMENDIVNLQDTIFIDFI